MCVCGNIYIPQKVEDKVTRKMEFENARKRRTGSLIDHEVVKRGPGTAYRFSAWAIRRLDKSFQIAKKLLATFAVANYIE